MKQSRRYFLKTGGTALAVGLASAGIRNATAEPLEGPAFSGKKLGSIYNQDIDGILNGFTSGGSKTVVEYQRRLDSLLDNRPGILAQNVGLPDPVIYPSKVATIFQKYMVELYVTWRELGDTAEDVEANRKLRIHTANAMNRFLDAGTDPFTLTIETCRKRGIPIVASYRMNSEDWYHNTWKLSDFGRAHPDWRIPKGCLGWTSEGCTTSESQSDRQVHRAGCLDPAIPGVFEHRMKIFTEVAEKFDIDGIEFDFRRWYHMVSNPLVNYPVLTRMVRETRLMLDQTARKKGRRKLLLGARVGPSLDTDPNPFVFPGSSFPRKPEDSSCKDLGLDVKTWIAEGLVDYLCPSLFGATLPGLPKTREFAALARHSAVGIYPTLWTLAPWQNAWPWQGITLAKKDEKTLAVYKDELCATALQMYEDGADGVSTFNWGGAGPGADAVQRHIYPLLGDSAAIRRYRQEPWAVPPKA